MSRVELARKLRKESTTPERALWSRLRQDALGVRFRRQHPVGPYVVDFACRELRIVIEVDGGQHASSITDATRDAWLRARGWRVLRYWNDQVLGNLDAVAEDVARVVAEMRSAEPV